MTAVDIELERQSAFRDELLAAGLLVSLGADGLYGRSGRFEDVVEAVSRIVGDLGRGDGADRVRFPPVEPRWVFERTDYLKSFPDLTGAVHTFTGGDADHARLLADAEAGADWSGHLQPADALLCPAVCHPLSPTIAGTRADGGRRFDVLGWVFRHEPSVDPARLQAFRQHEVVYVGDPAGARAHRDLWVDRGLDVLGSLGLEVEPVVANDPFFGRVGRMLAANQRDEELKIELVAEVASPDRLTAILSSNCHEDHFGAAFGITAGDGSVAHSACVGFGLERITLALLRRHGLDVDAWPAATRDRLWP
jgi:seryl-tRNA synthetase